MYNGGCSLDLLWWPFSNIYKHRILCHAPGANIMCYVMAMSWREHGDLARCHLRSPAEALSSPLQHLAIHIPRFSRGFQCQCCAIHRHEDESTSTNSIQNFLSSSRTSWARELERDQTQQGEDLGPKQPSHSQLRKEAPFPIHLRTSVLSIPTLSPLPGSDSLALLQLSPGSEGHHSPFPQSAVKDQRRTHVLGGRVSVNTSFHTTLSLC